jgi:hypothetical protein
VVAIGILRRDAPRNDKGSGGGRGELWWCERKSKADPSLRREDAAALRMTPFGESPVGYEFHMSIFSRLSSRSLMFVFPELERGACGGCHSAIRGGDRLREGE